MKNVVLMTMLLILQSSFAQANPEVKAGDYIIYYFKVFKGQNSDSQLLNNGQIAKIIEINPDGSMKANVNSIAFIANEEKGNDTAFGNDGANDSTQNLNDFNYEKLLGKGVAIFNNIQTGDQIECSKAGFFGPTATVKLGFTSKMAAVHFKNNPGWTMVIELEQWGCSKL